MMGRLIQLKNLTKIYKTSDVEFCALNNINLEIAEYEFSVIMGQSGSGKTTLMNIIGCLDRATNGEYLLREKKVSELQDDELSRVRNKEIGFVFQSFNLLPRATVLENVLLPLQYSKEYSRSETKELAEEILQNLGLKDKINNTPLQLSGGQQQRVAIARALVNKPKILCADEPTGNLDSRTGKEIMEIINELNQKGMTIILVTHDKEIAKYGKRIINLKDGKIIDNGE